jgi:heme/copper-type cytochrome/quinol oxidase subunit 3
MKSLVMRRQAVARDLYTRTHGNAPLPPSFGEGSPPFHEPPRKSPVNSARFGLLIFLAAETMFFTGLIGAFLVFRLGSLTWPPPSQPRLPVEATTINTLILLLSGLTMNRAIHLLRQGKQQGFSRVFLLTAVLGMIFLTLQGIEWVRLVQFGLSASSSTYGSTFYTLIGFHGAHVLGAVIWLAALLAAGLARSHPEWSFKRVEICGMYWYFVVALWPVLYVLVYLS